MTPMAKAGAYMGLVFVIPAAMWALWWLGDWADQKYGTNYWATTGMMVGFAAGLYEVLRQAKRIEKK
ncbi:MAG: AtpZ/AtpI family protein [Bryobacteraceae bacterium]|nr:AtpZ/AtpI family protein [Bryobacteraceae bacterium]